MRAHALTRIHRQTNFKHSFVIRIFACGNHMMLCLFYIPPHVSIVVVDFFFGHRRCCCQFVFIYINIFFCAINFLFSMKCSSISFPLQYNFGVVRYTNIHDLRNESTIAQCTIFETWSFHAHFIGILLKSIIIGLFIVMIIIKRFFPLHVISPDLRSLVLYELKPGPIFV